MMMFLLAPVAWRKHSQVLFALALVLLAANNGEALLVAASWSGLAAIAAAMLLVGLVPAAIAYRHGRSFLRWWLYGAVQFSAAFSSALRLKPVANADGTLRRCPHCRRWINALAIDCLYCDNEVTPLSNEELAAQKRAAKEAVRSADKLPRWLNRSAD